MAEKLSVELDVNATEAQKALAKFGGTLEDVHGEGVQPLNFAIGELEDRLYEMAAAGKAGTKEFEQMAAEVGRMKKVIVDVDMQVDGLSMSFSNKLAGTGQAVASGFELMQGAMGAFGAESEKVEEALLKVNSAMAMAQGLQGIKESIPAIKALWAALAANPLGLILTAITAIVAAFTYFATQVKTNFAKAFDNVTKSLDNYIKSLGKANEAQNKMLDKTLKGLDKEAARRIAMGEDAVKVQKEINSQKIKELEISIEQDKMAVKSLRLQKNRLLQSKEEVSLQYEKLILAQQEEVTFYRKAGLNEIALTYEIKMGKLAQEKLEMEKKIQTAINSTSETIVQRKEDIEANTDAVEDLKTSIIAMETEARKQYKETAEERRKAKWEQDIKDSEALLAAGKALTDAAKQRELESIEAIKRAEEGKYNYLNWLRAEDAKRKEEYDRLEQERIERNKQFAIDNAEATFTFISDLATIFEGQSEASQRRAFKVRKAASIAQTLVETYKAAQGAYASQIVPGDPSSPIRGAIAAAFATASGLAKVKAISSQKFEGGGSSAGGGGSASPSLPASSPANFTIVGNSGTNQLAETLTNAPIQAYVVGGEVTTQQSLDRNKIDVATW